MVNAGIVARWKVRLRIRLALLKRAEKRGDDKLILKRQWEVDEALRVIARHTPHRVTSISRAGVELIKRFEGFRGVPYRDAVGVWTIGYGHTENVGPHTPPLSEADATDLLARDLNRRYAPSVAALNLPLSQQQFDALVSFVYNVGPGGVAASTGVGRALRAKKWRAAGDAMLQWDRGGGKVLPGLVARRQAERALFLS